MDKPTVRARACSWNSSSMRSVASWRRLSSEASQYLPGLYEVPSPRAERVAVSFYRVVDQEGPSMHCLTCCGQ